MRRWLEKGEPSRIPPETVKELKETPSSSCRVRADNTLPVGTGARVGGWLGELAGGLGVWGWGQLSAKIVYFFQETVRYSLLLFLIKENRLNIIIYILFKNRTPLFRPNSV